jgi:Zn-finger nucleic acid-binding protein/ribosomal protein S27AE
MCREVAMREVGRRLVCDSCGGMQVSVDELERVMGAGEAATLIDDGASALVCPRCDGTMRGCRLAVGKLELDHALAQCKRDGVWFPGGALEDTFVRVGAAGHKGGGVGHRSGGDGRVSTYVPMYQPKHRPIPPPVPMSQFKDRRLPCPVCGGAALELALDRWTCAGCGGAFVENAALVVMVGEMIRGPWEMPPPHGADGKRACPVCTLAMQVEWFEDVEIDRCAEHGVWFDPTELGDALQHASGVGHRRGVAAWLKRLL